MTPIAPDLTERAVVALPATALLAAAAWRLRALDASGAIAGSGTAAAVWILGGPEAFALLGAFFILGSAATRYGWEEKAARGLAQERGGRRSARHVLANAGVGAVLAFLIAVSGSPEAFRLGLAGAFATAAFDTVSGEVGQVLGRRAFLVTSGKAVPPGTEGAVSLEGSLAGAVAASAVAGLGLGLGMFSAAGAGAVVAASAIGGFAESLAGATLGRRGLMGNELMNLLNTAVGGGLCAAAGLLVEA